MKNLKKILMCLSIVCCLALSVSCGDKNADSDDTNQQSTSSADNVNDSQDDNSSVDDKEDSTVTTTVDNSDNVNTDANAALSENYVTNADGSIVTDASGNAFVTEAVTNSDGSIVTDDSGNTVTQRVSVTTAVGGNNNQTNNNVVTTNNATTDSNNNNNATTTVNNSGGNDTHQTNVVLTVTEGNIVATTTAAPNEAPYFAKNRYSAFNWMSDDTKNKYDSGEIVEVTFKVLDNAKTGTYPIEMTYIDASNEKAEILNIPTINGTITVGNENRTEVQGAASSASFRLDNGYAKVGDTVTLKLYIDNNPGLSIFQVEFKYDNNALEVQSIIPSGAYANDSILSNMNFNQ